MEDHQCVVLLPMIGDGHDTNSASIVSQQERPPVDRADSNSHLREYHEKHRLEVRDKRRLLVRCSYGKALAPVLARHPFETEHSATLAAFAYRAARTRGRKRTGNGAR